MEKSSPENQFKGLKCDAKMVARCESISSNAGILVGLTGCLVLIGWFFNIPVLRSIHSSFVTMKFNAALCFVLTGLALWMLQSCRADRRAYRGIAVVSALGILGLAATTAWEYLFHKSLALDQFFYQELPGAVLTPHLGRMAFVTAINFTITGFALFLLGLKNERAHFFSQLLVLPLGILSLFVFAGYIFQAPPLVYGAHFSTAMALHTALLFLVTFLGVLFCRPREGLMRQLTSSFPGGRMLRRFLPVGIFLPLLLGGSELFLKKIGMVNHEVGQAFVALSNLSIITLYAYCLAVLLNHASAEKEKIQRSAELVEVGYRTLLASAKEGILVLDGENGGIVNCNACLREMLGYSEEELRGKNPWEMESFKGLVATPEAFSDLCKKGVFLIENLRSKTRKGREIDLEIVSSVFASGQYQFVQWNIRDVTERKREREKLLQLSCAVEQGPAIVMITNLAGNIEYVNPRFTQVTGYSFDEVLGKNPRILKSGEHSPAFYQEMWNVLRSGKVWRGQFLNKKKDGGHYWESASISPVFDRDGRRLCYIAIKEDISEFKKLERIKDDFISTISHELRTPLTAIKESLSLVLDGSMGVLTEEQKAFLGLGSRNADRLTALVASMLDFQKLQFGALELHMEKWNINEICEEVVRIMSSMAAKKGLTLHLEAAAGLPCVQVDRERIFQVLTSLVSNGIKFTSQGSVKISTVRQGENCLRVFVADTGPGIKPEEIEQIFRGFSQLGPAEYHLTGSAGLGLALAKGIIVQHRGKIGVESTLGMGSVFYFEIPFEERRKSP